jgi:hypothetical protein
LRVLPPYREISVTNGELADYAILAKRPLSASEASRFPYVAGWEKKFDYVLVFDSGAVPDPKAFLPERLELVHATDMAALFKVK